MTNTHGSIFLDSFSGAIADLPPRMRTPEHLLAALRRDQRISTFDFSEKPWLWEWIKVLQESGAIREEVEPYPWHRYIVVEGASND